MNASHCHKEQSRLLVSNASHSAPLGRRLGRLIVRPLVRAITLSCFGVGLLVSTYAHADSPVVTKYTYDAGNNIASVTDPRGLVTTYVHDGLDQLWQQVSPDTGTTLYNYDSFGRETSMIRADGTQTAYGYDGLNRLISISAGGLTQSYSYDNCTNGVGRVCSDGDSNAATSYSYTPEGWIAGRGFTIGSKTYSLGYSYDVMGHITTVNYPDNNQANYTYTNGAVSDVSLKIDSATVTGAATITYQPMDMGINSWSSSNGLVNTMHYDIDGRLTAIDVPGVQALGFSYDNANRITQISNGIDGSQTQYFGYDAMSRLVSVNSAADNESFQYDANGNRLVQTGTIDTVSSTSNRLLSSGTNQYGYDAQGNTITINGATTYQYDSFNRMSSAIGTTYYVNPEGQRLRKTGAAGTTYFAPDQSGSLLAENPDGTWIDYVWLGGRLIGRIANKEVYAIHTDQVGRPEIMTDSNQNIVWQAQNFAFTQNVTIADVVLNLGFPGQYYDIENSTWNNGFRDYSSGLGRYLESDPLGLGGGINTYAYVENNPLSYTDAFGLEVDPCGVADWLKYAYGQKNTDPLATLMDARNHGMDKGDSNLVAAERYLEGYNGDYNSVYFAGIVIVKWARVVPGVDRVLGRNGSPASDAIDESAYGDLGIYEKEAGNSAGTTPFKMAAKSKCNCGDGT